MVRVDRSSSLIILRFPASAVSLTFPPFALRVFHRRHPTLPLSCSLLGKTESGRQAILKASLTAMSDLQKGIHQISCSLVFSRIQSQSHCCRRKWKWKQRWAFLLRMSVSFVSQIVMNSHQSPGRRHSVQGVFNNLQTNPHAIICCPFNHCVVLIKQLQNVWLLVSPSRSTNV